MTSWKLLDNNPASMSIVANGDALYQLHNNGQIFGYTGTPLTGWQELDNNPATWRIAVGDGGRELYQLHDSGRIFSYTESAPHPYRTRRVPCTTT
jgi:hypothetical protein